MFYIEILISVVIFSYIPHISPSIPSNITRFSVSVFCGLNARHPFVCLFVIADRDPAYSGLDLIAETS